MNTLKSLEELFGGRHFDREIILCVRWYLRYKLSLRDLVEMIPQGDFLRGVAERGLSLAHTTILLLKEAVKNPGMCVAKAT